MQKNVVIMYDSKSIRGLSEDIKEQIKQIHGVPCKVAVPRITQQRGSKDCGLYAIERPQNVVFHQKKMMDHLIKCFSTQQMNSLPEWYIHSKQSVGTQFRCIRRIVATILKLI